MEDVLSVYQRPYDPRLPKICMDEGSKQLLSHSREPIKMQVGKAERIDYEYEREGVCSVFVAVEPETGACLLRVSERRTKKDWARFLREVIDVHYPHAEKIVLVMVLPLRRFELRWTPGNRIAIRSTSRSTGVLRLRMLASNSNVFTHQLKSDRLLVD